MIPLKYIQSIKIATEVAFASHKDQKRKHAETPYVIHPARVSQLVLMYNTSEYLGAITAWLHDVIEDCGPVGQTLFENGLKKMPLTEQEKSKIVSGVYALTKDDSILPRQRKWDDAILRVMDINAPKFVKLVKICDRIDNLMDLNGFTKEFVVIYLAETNQLIDILDHARLEWVAEDEALDTLKLVYKQRLQDC